MLESERKASDIVILSNRGAMDRRRLLTTPQAEIETAMRATKPDCRTWIDPQLAAVYVVSNAANSLLKIGHADNLKSRFAGLNCGSPIELELRHFVYFVGRLVAKSVEKQVHEVLSQHRIRGEWFEIDEMMASSTIANVVTERKLPWWTDGERVELGRAAIDQHAHYFFRDNFFLRN